MNRFLPPLARRVLLAMSAGALLLALRPAQGDVNALPSGNAESLGEARNFDRRIEHNRGFSAPARAAIVPPALAAVPDLDLSRDDAFGTTRSVSSLTTYLTAARPGEDAMKVALDFVGDGSALGLTPGDLADFEVTDVVTRKSPAPRTSTCARPTSASRSTTASST